MCIRDRRLHIQIRGNQRGLFTQNPFIDTQEKLGYRKGIRQLRAQIVDDQQVTVKEIGVGLLVILRATLASKSCFRQHIEELKGSQVDDGMAAVHEPVSYTHLDVYKRQGNPVEE